MSLLSGERWSPTSQFATQACDNVIQKWLSGSYRIIRVCLQTWIGAMEGTQTETKVGICTKSGCIV